MKKLFKLNEVIQKITTGEKLILAADENLLDQLPKGNWIAGTIPYFMGDGGGEYSKKKLFVDEIPSESTNISIKVYNETTLPGIASDEFDNGYSMIIIPANSKIHISFAENSNKYENIFHNPLVGWISGVDLADLGEVKPKVYNGLTKEKFDDSAVVMHIELPKNKVPTIDIINLFDQGNGDAITFDSTGFSVSYCFVNGEKQSLASYLKNKNVDTRLPLVANYCGAMINTSFQLVDLENDAVHFYAPVFEGIEYKIAKSVSDYVKEFTSLASGLDKKPAFTCNCILNYLYSELKGKKTGSFTGPMTFGEIAYQLLNQTLVYLTINDI